VRAAAAGLALADETATLAAGARLGHALASQPASTRSPCMVALSGELGAGKTTFARGVLRSLGVSGAVRSPSYTLVEEYAAAGWDVLHLDLYRLAPGEDLQELGVRDRHHGAALLLVEWPERAPPAGLPPADLALRFDIGPTGHRVAGDALTLIGKPLLAAILAGAAS
jgi:tRNA threonylcarbamoyladenosine biosynthesis protein TsaE